MATNEITQNYESGLIEDDDDKTFTLPTEKLDTDFKKAYPPDPLGKEMDDSARVWKVYRDQAIAHDNALLDGWSRTLDILLIFAGLFSAVATAFVVESAKLLQPDNDAYMATSLYLLVAASGASGTASLPLPPKLETSVSMLSRWINGLWFTSLLLSLTVALLSILVKQWIGEYISRNAASAESRRHWARRRQLYFQALTAWPVAYLVSLLPLMLHLSLFSFLAGIICYLWSLDQAIGVWFIMLSVALVVFYLACTFVPIWRPESPTHTPLVNQMREAWVSTQILALRSSIIVTRGFSRISVWLEHTIHSLLRKHREEDLESLSKPSIKPCFVDSLFIAHCRRTIARLDERRTDQALVQSLLLARKDELDTEALEWLIGSVSNSDAVAVGLQALGALHPDSRQAERLRTGGQLGQINARRALTRTTTQGWNPVEVTRVARSMLCMEILPPRLTRRHGVVFDVPLPTDDYPDMALINASMNHFFRERLVSNATRWRDGSPTTTSTCVLLMRSDKLQASEIMCLLLCCRLEELGAADWTYIARSFVQGQCRIGPPLAHAQTSPGRLWLADGVAQLIMQRRRTMSYDIPVATRLIDDLLSVSPLRGFTDTVQLRDYPFLWDFLASAHFRHAEHDLKVLSKIAKLLGHPSSRARNNGPTLRLFRVAASIMHVGSTHPPLLFSPIIDDLSWFFVHAFNVLESDEHVDPSQPSRHIYAPIKLVLRPNALPGMQQSLWGMMHHAQYAHSSFVYFAGRVASALCCLSRAHEDGVEDLIEDFFRELRCGLLLGWCATMWDDRNDFSQDDIARQCTRLVQHSTELQPSWWADGLANLGDGGDPRTEEFAALVDKEAMRLGPCKHYP
ncbi:hypothetical protein EXIGLDRAFT_758172 [Exidia glandulosa HHB12029]|uniref:DUF6535 domain-containing protein n=1 Tax=Exidia glandulosa HHB12029 TaxID=1314781 RepID=A0A165QNB9_EXIGL|nr:hypothetical protein EXIGLDRAFT_758172 [Exidia glandulosa HHB12029]